MAKWLIDAGHGGTDPGAVYKGRTEASDVLKLAKDVGSMLTANGESVSYTRTEDKTLSLTARTNIENKGTYDYFISVHRNAAGPEVAKGVETYIYKSGNTSNPLATKVNNNLVSVGFLDRKVKVANFHVLRETKCKAILIEVGFIDNSIDNGIFDNAYSKIVAAIAKACLEQVGKTPVENPPIAPVPPSESLGEFKIGTYNGNARITTDVLRVRSGRGTEHSIIGELKKNDVVKINYILPDDRDGIGDSSLWGSFDFKGQIGYIHLGYAEPTSLSVNVKANSPRMIRSINLVEDKKFRIVGEHYSSGELVPSGIKEKEYSIEEVDAINNRALLKEINCWVNLGDLK